LIRLRLKNKGVVDRSIKKGLLNGALFL